MSYSATSWTATCQASLSFTISQNLLKLMSIESVMPSSRLTLCHPLLFLPSIFPASESFPMSRLFASGDQSFSFSIGPSSEHSGVISFRAVWFDLFVFQGTLKCLLQHHSFGFSILKTPGRSRHYFDICSIAYIFHMMISNVERSISKFRDSTNGFFAVLD